MIGSPIDEIKNRLDIVEVIGSYIKLKKSGQNYTALCPFHSEKKPSFFVSPSRQIWHCFGCVKGGDVFKFVMEIENVEFGDALRTLAQKAGIELKPQSPELKTQRQRLYEICEISTKFFEKQLEESSVGKEAKKYLLERGISEDSIHQWRLGYSPDTWNGLSDFLSSKEYKKEELEKAGLAIENEQGSFYDRFRGRIIFPVFDLNSQVVGFGGRIFRIESDSKYINTPTTLLYDKGKILYGLDRAKVEIRKKNACILVEGYIDCILSHQVGAANVVATSGTALTPYQLATLRRYSSNLILSFDMDIGGDSATKRGIDLAQMEGFSINVLSLPKEEDPADVISKNPQNWQTFIKDSKSILDFYFDSAFLNRDPKTLEGKKEISKILLPVIKKIPNQIEKGYWIDKLAQRLDVREKDLEEELSKTRLENYDVMKKDKEEKPIIKKTRKELLEERLLSLLLKKPEKINMVDENEFSCFSPPGKTILTSLKKDVNSNFAFSKSENELRDFFNYLLLKSEIERIDENEIDEEIRFCLHEINCIETKNQLNQISRDIKRAEAEKDFKKVGELSQKFQQLAKNLTD